jgi:hypothetical protein
MYRRQDVFLEDFYLILLNKMKGIYCFVVDTFAANYSIGTRLQNFNSNAYFMVNYLKKFGKSVFSSGAMAP